jgi:Zn ribbon nucleic-acid-binding protein
MLLAHGWTFSFAGGSASRLPGRKKKKGSRSSGGRQPLNGPRAESGQFCANCGVLESSMWRKEKGTDRVNCNACGLYFNTKGKYRDPNGKAMRSGVKKTPADKVCTRELSLKLLVVF